VKLMSSLKFARLLRMLGLALRGRLYFRISRSTVGRLMQSYCDRPQQALPSEGRGREFESRRVRHQVFEIVENAVRRFSTVAQNGAATRRLAGHVSDTGVFTTFGPVSTRTPRRHQGAVTIASAMAIARDQGKLDSLRPFPKCCDSLEIILAAGVVD
jgi:hypothetical protein